MKKSLGVYLHIPFCLQKCHYCDFCSFPGLGPSVMEAYTEELCRRMEQTLPDPQEWQIDTVYFGGGTPTLLPISCFEKLCDCLSQQGDLAPNCEITCECNPATADLAYLSDLRKMGVNRLSIGLQSTDDRELALLGRAHTYGQFLQTFRQARKAGFDNISADLMYGIPDQTQKSFEKSLTELAELGPEHISSYGLSIEDGTVFAKKRPLLNLPDEEEEFSMYCAMTDVLSRYGYRKYEISNFAKENRESRHNLRYWQRKDYLGFGTAAHSCFEGVRFGNARDLTGFLAGRNVIEERTVLTERDCLYEQIMLGLRLADGIEESLATKCGSTECAAKIRAFVENGFLRRSNGRISFTDRGFFVSNSILSDLLGFLPISEDPSLQENLSEKNC